MMETLQDMGCLYYSWLGSLMLCTLLIVYTDISWYWIPDAAVCIVAVSNGIGWLAGLFQPNCWLGLVIAVFLGVAYMCYPAGMGSGDVKLTAALCLGCTEYMAYGMIVIAFLTACITAGCLRLYSCKSVIPFGPFLWIGWWSMLGIREEYGAWFLLHENIIQAVDIFYGSFWSSVL